MRQPIDPAPRVAVGITVAVMAGFAFVEFDYVLAAHPPPWQIALAVVLLGATLALQAFHSFVTSASPFARWRGVTLAAQAVLAFVPLALYQVAWLGMPTFVAASCLLVLPPRLGWPAWALTAVADGVATLKILPGLNAFFYDMIAVPLEALVLFGASRLALLVRINRESRAELARMAIAAERLRFARDLHDLLGYSLSSITLKCELTRRVLASQPDRADAELAEILQITSQALAELGTVTSGPGQLTLATELDSAYSTLKGAGIDVTIRTGRAQVHGITQTVLATTIREAVTNMLRHSKATRCLIEISQTGEQITLRIANDGTGEPQPPATAPSAAGGHGLANLAYRTQTLGGDIRAARVPGGWFELIATLPARQDGSGEPGEE
jgi:two-component system sensor histidine kinase DesK